MARHNLNVENFEMLPAKNKADFEYFGAVGGAVCLLHHQSKNYVDIVDAVFEATLMNPDAPEKALQAAEAVLREVIAEKKRLAGDGKRAKKFVDEDGDYDEDDYLEDGCKGTATSSTKQMMAKKLAAKAAGAAAAAGGGAAAESEDDDEVLDEEALRKLKAEDDEKKKAELAEQEAIAKAAAEEQKRAEENAKRQEALWEKTRWEVDTADKVKEMGFVALKKDDDDDDFGGKKGKGKGKGKR